MKRLENLIRKAESKLLKLTNPAVRWPSSSNTFQLGVIKEDEHEFREKIEHDFVVIPDAHKPAAEAEEAEDSVSEESDSDENPGSFKALRLPPTLFQEAPSEPLPEAHHEQDTETFKPF